jgi:tetratricopeptide (TPR) repeat protein
LGKDATFRPLHEDVWVLRQRTIAALASKDGYPGRMMPSIADSLVVIVAHLTRLRRPVARVLQPGLSRSEIAKVEASHSLALSPELVALYRRTNGASVNTGDDLDKLHLFPGYYLLSLKDAARAYRQQRRSSRWKADWFPFFANDAGDYYAVSCARKGSPGVIGFLLGEPDQPVEYASLRAMLATLAACFAERAFFVTKGDLAVDDDKHLQIATRLNPGVSFWTQEEEAAVEADRNAAAYQLAVKATKLSQTKPLEALAMFEKAVLVPDHAPWVYVNALYAVNVAFEKRGVESSRIRRMLDICLQQQRPHADLILNAAFAWMAIGESDKCIEYLKKARSKGVELKKHLVSKLFAPLHADKRFIALQKSTT